MSQNVSMQYVTVIKDMFETLDDDLQRVMQQRWSLFVSSQLLEEFPGDLLFSWLLGACLSLSLGFWLPALL